MVKSEEECGYGKKCNVTTFPYQGICPDNWHIPTKGEWDALREFIA